MTTRVISLQWKRFRYIDEAKEAVNGSCIYMIADVSRSPLYIGATARFKGKGKESERYKGGNTSVIDAALHESGKWVFAALIADDVREDVERLLIIREQPKFNKRKWSPTVHYELNHGGDVPTFCHKELSG